MLSDGTTFVANSSTTSTTDKSYGSGTWSGSNIYVDVSETDLSVSGTTLTFASDSYDKQ